MAKLENYTGSVELISGIKQKNNGDFPLMEAHSVQVDESGKRLDELLEEKADKSYVVEIFEQLKELIQTGEITQAVALLDSAILDLSTLA